MKSCGTCKDRIKCNVGDVKVCSSNGYCNYAPEKTTSNTAYTKLPTLDDIFAHLKDVQDVENINKNMVLLKQMYGIIQKLGNFA